MAVYTHLTHDQITDFLSAYDIGELSAFEGIIQGIDNTNYKIETTQALYILTIFESRIDPKDLPFFLSFMEHLSKDEINCPAPILQKDHTVISPLSNKPAAIFPFLDGRGVESPDITVSLCQELGVLLAKMHLSGQSHKNTRKNSMGFDAWESRLLKTKEHGKEFLEHLQKIKSTWPTDLPRGTIHADLFPDNVFIKDIHIHGVIDFYFSATDFLAYDLAIVLNAWCFTDQHELDHDKWSGLLDGYQSIRPLIQQEKSVFQILCQGAALRFLSSRLHDLVFHDEKALVKPKDPTEYIKKLEFHRDTNLF